MEAGATLSRGAGSSGSVPWGEALRTWLRIGCLGFGGPAGQIALMHRILVEEKRWISEARFLHALSYCMLLPGPEAQQLATYVGWLLHRFIEIDKTIKAKNRPVVVITSNAKKDLSDPFLGRCNFHHIAFPEPVMMRKIVGVHFPQLSDERATACLQTFYWLRDIGGMEKKPATRELINWIRALKSDPDYRPAVLQRGEVPYLGVLYKKSADLGLAAKAIARLKR